MAFAFGDSYLKLPPISNSEGSVEIDGENTKRGSAGIVRDKHGLVRLPPIVRLDSLRSASSTPMLRKEQTTATTVESDSELPMLGSPLKIAHKMDSLRHHESSNKHKIYTTEKREDETKLIKEQTVMETNEYDASVFDSGDTTRGKQKASRFRLGINNSRDETEDGDLTPLYSGSMTRRRGSSTLQTWGKLSKSLRLAKSSPELSNRKINSRMRADRSVMSSLAGGLRPSSRSRFSQARLSVHDIDGSVLSHLQNTSKINAEKPNEHGKRRKNRGNQRWVNDGTTQPQSTPSSPVCSESVNKEIKQKGRKSLNDITDAQQFADRRRPSLAPKRQSFLLENEGLKIEGKSCPQSERETQRAPTEFHGDTLHPPQQGEKRHSLYDLQQILTLLQEENLKRKSSASTPRNLSATSNASADKNPNASVYDLKEFLKLAAAEASNSTAGQQRNKTKASSHLLPPGQERDNSRSERKGSVYDLMEFLSLGNIGGETESGSASENASRAATPRIVLSPRSVPSGSSDLLSVAKNTEEGRRSSTYDLMEFLSLPRSGGSSRSDSGPSSPALQGEEPTWPSAVQKEENEQGKHKREKRSLSVYDLAEFLNMTASIPPLVRVTPSHEEQAKPSAESAEGDTKKDFQNLRESVYDLREILNVMQQEHEKKRESTYNLQEILSHFQREAEEATQLASASATSQEKDTLASPSPPMTASSGYSTASDSSPAKTLETNTANRQMSVYDLREFLSLYAAQQSQPNQQQLPASMLRRKFSNVSQSGVSIHVTDESNRSIDSEVYEDVFLPVPGTEAGVADPSRKRNSIYDLREFLSILNADESPLRRRLSSVSSASSKSSESESESNSATSEKHAGTRPQLSPRQDSGGSVSLYDLGEFLSVLNSDESPLRRRLSSASDAMSTQGDSGARTPVLSRTDSEKALYNLQEILIALNDLEQKRNSENVSGELETDTSEEISIQVPTLHPKTDGINTGTLAPKKRLQPQRSLNSVPETSEEKSGRYLSNSI